MNSVDSRLPIPVGDTALGDFLYPDPAERRPGAIIRWWERRRIPFNVIVGGSGLVTIGLASLFTLLPPQPPGIVAFPWVGVLAYGVLANLCYTLGPAAELLVDRLFGDRVLPIGPLLFRAGLTLSIGLTVVVPTILLTIAWVIRIIVGF